MVRLVVRSVMMALAATVVASCAKQEPYSPLLRAAEQMGAAHVTTMRYEATGAYFALGQSARPGAPWPRFDVVSLVVEADYASAAMRQEITRSRSEPPRGGGGQPLTGEQTQVHLMAGTSAWNITDAAAVPQPAAVARARALQLWMTPHGFIKGALLHAAAVEQQPNGESTVRFTVMGTYELTGTIGPDHLVERVEAALENPVLGDMPIVAIYEAYRDVGGVRFPSHIRQTRGGHPVYDLTVTRVMPGAAVSIVPPAEVASIVPDAARVEIEEIDEGVHYVTGGSHHSVVIEFGDHLAVVEAPLGDERAEAVIAAIGEVLPGKAIRYLINTHHHFDHSGGMRAFVAEGAIIVTHEINRPFYEQAWAAPRTLAPDRLSRSPREPEFITVEDWHQFTDRRRLIEVHHIEGNPHDDGMLMVWMPRERLLIQADAYTPGPPGAPAPATPNPFSVNFHRNILRLRLDVDLIVPIHGRIVELGDLEAAIGWSLEASEPGGFVGADAGGR